MKSVVIASDISYIDPVNCDSSIGYKLVTEPSYLYKKKLNVPSFNAYIDLTDCNRKITWQFENNEESLQKINKAITMLTAFKKELIKARKMFPKDSDEDSD